MPVRGDNSLFFATGIDNSGLLRGKAEAEGIIQSLGTSISRINPFAALAVGATAAFTLIANEGYKMVRSFESSMNEVKTIANLPEAEFQKLKQDVFDLYKQLGTEPPDKLAKGLYEIIGAGFEAGDALKILEIASKSATAGVTETAVASDGLTTILNAFKLEASDAQEVADIMFATVDRGKISFEELSSQIATVAPLAASSNISFEEIGAAIATLTKQGVPAGVAMTQIRSAIISTNEVLGDGAFKTLTLQEGLQKMLDISGGSQNKLKELAGRIEAVNGILGIAGDNFVGASQDLDAMANSAGQVDKAFSIITSSNVNQWQIFKERLRATTAEIGDFFLGMSNKIVGDLNKIFDANDRFSGILKSQADRINELYIEYTDLNTEEERRIEILKEIESINPTIVEGINNQTDAYDKLGDSVRRFNEYVINKELIDKKFGDDISNTQDIINQYVKNRKSVELDLREQYAEFISNLPSLGDKYRNELNKVLDGDYDFIDKIRKIREIIENNNADSSSSNNGVRNIVADDFFSDIEDYDSYAGTIELFTKRLNQLNEEARLFGKNLEDTAQNAPIVIAEINKINSLSELNQRFGDYETKAIKDALESRSNYLTERKRIEGEIQKINSITSGQYKENNNILKQFLDSENKEIQQAAERRKKFFEFTPNVNTEDEDTFSDKLQEKEEAYKQYALAVSNNDLELAEKLKSTYKLKEDNYVDYLRNLYKVTTDEVQKANILTVLQKQGSSLNDRGIASSIGLKQNTTVVLDFQLDLKSYNAIQREIQKLTKKALSTEDESEQLLLGKKIEAEKAKLKAIEDRIFGQKEEEESFFEFLQSSSMKELFEKKKQYQKELQQLRLSNKEKTDAYKELQNNLQAINEKIGQDFANTAQQFSAVFSEVSGLFQKFGDEDGARLMQQLSGVASGVASFATGLATKNPLQMLQGGMQVLNSALNVNVVSDTSNFERQIDRLEKAIEKLDYTISRSIGMNRIDNRRKAIRDLEELEQKAQKTLDAEKKAREQVKFLGITISDKGEGSGTSSEKLEELEQKAEEARQKAQELKDQLDELYTGTTEETIVDSIINGLKEGKTSVEDFANDFERIMQDALLNAFKIKFLEEEIEKFYANFSSAGEDGTFDAEEINKLRDLYNLMISGAQEDIDAINQILNESGIGSLGSSSSNNNNSLSGSVSRSITEETAGVLAGLWRSVADDIRQGIIQGQSALDYLQKIEENTSNTVLEIKKAVTHLESIDDTTEDHFRFIQ